MHLLRSVEILSVEGLFATINSFPFSECKKSELLRNYINKCVVPNSEKFLSFSAYTTAEGPEITGTDSSPLPAGRALTMNECY